jgi:hypothetical protein
MLKKLYHWHKLYYKTSMHLIEKLLSQTLSSGNKKGFYGKYQTKYFHQNLILPQKVILDAQETLSLS